MTPTCVAPRHVDAWRDSPNEQRARGGGGGGGAARLFFFFSPVQQTTSGIGHRRVSFFRAGNQCAECEKLQQQQPYHKNDSQPYGLIHTLQLQYNIGYLVLEGDI